MNFIGTYNYGIPVTVYFNCIEGKCRKLPVEFSCGLSSEISNYFLRNSQQRLIIVNFVILFIIFE